MSTWFRSNIGYWDYVSWAIQHIASPKFLIKSERFFNRFNVEFSTFWNSHLQCQSRWAASIIVCLKNQTSTGVPPPPHPNNLKTQSSLPNVRHTTPYSGRMCRNVISSLARGQSARSSPLIIVFRFQFVVLIYASVFNNQVTFVLTPESRFDVYIPPPHHRPSPLFCYICYSNHPPRGFRTFICSRPVCVWIFNPSGDDFITYGSVECACVCARAC